MEAKLDQMESPDDSESNDPDVSDLNDLLYQATLADAQGVGGDEDADSEDGVVGEMEDLDDEAEDGEEDLASLMEDMAEEAEAAEGEDAEAVGDMDTLLEDVDAEVSEGEEDLASLTL